MTPLLSLGMTDRDVIEAARQLIERLGGRSVRTRLSPLPSGKVSYVVSLTGLPAVKIMWAVLPFMGERRSRDIRRIVAEWTPQKYSAAVAFQSEITGVQGSI